MQQGVKDSDNQIMNADTKMQKNSKLLQAALLQITVSNQYEEFREWLEQNEGAYLDLSNLQEKFHLGFSLNLLHVGQALCSTGIRTLDLSGNYIGGNGVGEGVMGVGELISNNDSLTVLHLRHNNIGEVDAKEVGEALANNTSLKTLNLDHNEIGDEGAKWLSELLPKNHSLEILSLRENSISDKGADLIAACIERTNLLKVELGFKHQGLQDALERNNQKIVFTPYYTASSQYSPKKEKSEENLALSLEELSLEEVSTKRKHNENKTHCTGGK